REDPDPRRERHSFTIARPPRRPTQFHPIPNRPHLAVVLENLGRARRAEPERFMSGEQWPCRPCRRVRQPTGAVRRDGRGPQRGEAMRLLRRADRTRQPSRDAPRGLLARPPLRAPRRPRAPPPGRKTPSIARTTTRQPASPPLAGFHPGFRPRQAGARGLPVVARPRPRLAP